MWEAALLAQRVCADPPQILGIAPPPLLGKDGNPVPTCEADFVSIGGGPAGESGGEVRNGGRAARAQSLLFRECLNYGGAGGGATTPLTAAEKVRDQRTRIMPWRILWPGFVRAS